MLSFSASLSLSLVNIRLESCIGLRDEDEEELSSRTKKGKLELDHSTRDKHNSRKLITKSLSNL